MIVHQMKEVKDNKTYLHHNSKVKVKKSLKITKIEINLMRFKASKTMKIKE